MKKVFLFVITAGMICCFHSCKMEDGPGQEELIPEKSAGVILFIGRMDELQE